MDIATRRRLLDRLWRAFLDDGVEYVSEVADRWGELCANDEDRQKCIDTQLPMLLENWSHGTAGGYFRGTSAIFSCLLALGRNQEALDLANRAPSKLWHYREYGVKALAALGRHKEAIDYAEASRSPYNSDTLIDEACQDVLLSQGKRTAAYEQYAASPDSAGAWFATARQIGCIDLAVQLAQRSHCDPHSLNRAAKALLNDNPAAAVEIALASLHWIGAGYGYEITSIDAYSACHTAMTAAHTVGRTDEVARRIDELARAYPNIYGMTTRFAGPSVPR